MITAAWADYEGATAVHHVSLDVADKLVDLFDGAPFEAAGLLKDVPTGVLHYGFVVPDVDAAHADLAASGVEFFMEPTTFGDLRIAFLSDSDGVPRTRRTAAGSRGRASPRSMSATTRGDQAGTSISAPPVVTR